VGLDRLVVHIRVELLAEVCVSLAADCVVLQDDTSDLDEVSIRNSVLEFRNSDFEFFVEVEFGASVQSTDESYFFLVTAADIREVDAWIVWF